MVVEPALADGDGSVYDQRAERRDVALGVESGGIVWMDAGGAEHEPRILQRAPRRDRRGGKRLTNADDRGRARIAGAGNYLVAVAGERRVREVGVAVDEDGRVLVLRGHLRSIQRSTGAAT